MKKRIAIDMDEVIADFMQELLDRFNNRMRMNITKQELVGKRLWEHYPQHGKFMSDLVDEPDFFRHLKVMENSQEVIRELQETYEIFIATAAMERPTSFKAKYEWLKEHFSFISDSHFVFCGDKTIIHADYLIDDTPRQFEGFSGQGILYTAAHNLSETRYVRVNNWEEVRHLFSEQADVMTEISSVAK